MEDGKNRKVSAVNEKKLKKRKRGWRDLSEIAQYLQKGTGQKAGVVDEDKKKPKSQPGNHNVHKTQKGQGTPLNSLKTNKC